MSEWQPIETAPKDGTAILVRFKHLNFKYAKTDEERDLWHEICVAKWIDHNDGGWTWYGICGQATHWMPLPDPPKAD